MKQVAILTSKMGLETLEAGERFSKTLSPLVEELESRGEVRCTARDWEGLSPEEAIKYDLVMPGFMWDYWPNSGNYLQFVKGPEESGANLWNGPRTLNWNVSKKHLLDLRDQGVKIVETIFVSQGSSWCLFDVMEKHGWTEAVTKPAVSGDSFDTKLIRLSTFTDAVEGEFQRSVAQYDMLIQEFIPEIQSNGELQLAFFGGKFADAIHKVPSPGRFFSNRDNRGTIGFADAHPAIQRIAIQILEAAREYTKEETLYARVDGLNSMGANGENFTLMELELIEPSFHPQLLMLVDQKRTMRMIGLYAEAILKLLNV